MPAVSPDHPPPPGGRPLRILMLGWEFPPFISGGLGTACQGLTAAMNRLRLEVLFVLPKAKASALPAGGRSPTVDPEAPGTSRLPGSHGLQVRRAEAELPSPYTASGQRARPNIHRPMPVTEPMPLAETPEGFLRILSAGVEGGYGGDMYEKIRDYAQACVKLAADERFDIIHAHDWMTFPAAEALAEAYHKPAVVHVHATEYDRAGEGANERVAAVEKQGAAMADRVIAVSALTKTTLVEQYGQDENKIEVVHNGMEVKGRIAEPVAHQRDHKVVLFLGRITMQKGPEYFVDMAQRVCEQRDDVRFIVVGWGDMGPMMIERVIHAGLASKVLFTGFLRGKDVERAFANADVYVMPSISEPFGLTPLEALRHGVPVVISKRSGVAEVLTMGALKVDFWDIDKMADYVLAVLNRPALSYVLAKAGGRELRRLTWDKAAKKCLRIYHRVLDIPEPPKPKAVIDPTKPVKPMMGGEDAPDDLSDLVDDEQPGLSPGA